MCPWCGECVKLVIYPFWVGTAALDLIQKLALSISRITLYAVNAAVGNLRCSVLLMTSAPGEDERLSENLALLPPGRLDC